MSDFADRLSALVSKEMTEAKRDPERMAEVLERLAAAVGFSAAIMARGDGAVIDNLLIGVDAHAHAEAVHKAQFAKMIAVLAHRWEQ